MNLESYEKQKLNIVCSGGEMKGGFTAGFLQVFLKAEILQKFDIIFYCISASVPTVLYHMSYSTDVPDEKIWIDELSSNNSKIKNGIMRIDVESIIKNIFKKYPLDVEKICSHKDTIIFGVYNVDLKKVEYVSNKKIPNHIYLADYDIYDLVKAAISAPVLYDKAVKIGKYSYCDPGLKTHCIIPENKNKTIFVLQNKNFAYRKILFAILFFYGLWKRKNLPYFRFAYLSIRQIQVYKTAKIKVKNGSAFLVEPIKKLRGTFNFSMSKKDLKYNFEIGKKAYSRNRLKIQKFLLK